jgi:hypothetical protein
MGGDYNTGAQFKIALVKTGEVRNGYDTGSKVVVKYYPVWYGKPYDWDPGCLI